MGNKTKSSNALRGGPGGASVDGVENIDSKGKNQGENMIKKVLATVVAASMQARTLIGGVLAAGAMVLGAGAVVLAAPAGIALAVDPPPPPTETTVPPPTETTVPPPTETTVPPTTETTVPPTPTTPPPVGNGNGIGSRRCPRGNRGTQWRE